MATSLRNAVEKTRPQLQPQLVRVTNFFHRRECRLRKPHNQSRASSCRDLEPHAWRSAPVPDCVSRWCPSHELPCRSSPFASVALRMSATIELEPKQVLDAPPLHNRNAPLYQRIASVTRGVSRLRLLCSGGKSGRPCRKGPRFIGATPRNPRAPSLTTPAAGPTNRATAKERRIAAEHEPNEVFQHRSSMAVLWNSRLTRSSDRR